MTLNIKDIKESLTTDEIISLVIPDAEYEGVLTEIAGSLSKDYDKILYISIDRPYEVLVCDFEQNNVGLDKFYFIDCITRTEKDVSSTKNCTYVSSPRALDEIESAILDVLEKQRIDVTLIDSISSLLTYYEHADVLKFIHSLDCKLIVKKSKGIFPFRKEDESRDLRRSAEMFADRTIEKRMEDFFG